MADVTRIPTKPHGRKRRTEWLFVGGVLVVLAAVLAYAARNRLTRAGDDAALAAKPQVAERARETKAGPPTAVAVDDGLIDDDGKTLWVSPTHGPPLDLAYLSPGVEVVVALRPEALASHPEGEKVLAALAPIFGDRFAFVRGRLPGVAGVKQLTLGAFARRGQWQVTIVAHLSGRLTAREFVASAFPHAQQALHRGKEYWVVGEYAYFAPENVDAQLLVVAPVDAIGDIVDLAGNPPPLQRDLERLLAHTDAMRQVTAIAPWQLFLRHSEAFLPPALVSIQSHIESLLGEDTAVAAISLNWDENFFIELVAVPTLDSSPAKLSDELARRVDILPNEVGRFVLGLDPTPYGAQVVARLPEMVRRLAAYTRHGFDKDAAVLRCYLPAVAGHNLLMGAELALAEGQGSGTARRNTSPLAEASSPATIDGRLQKQTSLRFAREELEAALDMLDEDIGVPIRIRGADLQLDGITRNQLFAIDMADRPAGEILVEILRRANPDKLATGPADERQKLVYVVGPEAIFITTRSAAAGRGETLPAVFQGQ